MKNDQDPLS